MKTIDVNDFPLSGLQAEKGEWVILPDGSLVKSAAKKKHSQMKDDEVTDALPENSYILSHDPDMKLTREDFKDLALGKELIHYKEGEMPKMPKDITFDQFFTKRRNTPAEIGANMAKKYPVWTEEEHKYNPFVQLGNTLNKESRTKPLAALQTINEIFKNELESEEEAEEYGEENPLNFNQPAPKFKRGGKVKKYNWGGGDIFSGMAGGAMAGAPLGAWGVAGGAAVGGISSAIMAAQRKKEQRKREAERKQIFDKLYGLNDQNRNVNHLTTLGKLATPLAVKDELDLSDYRSQIDQAYDPVRRRNLSRRYGYNTAAQAPSNSIIRNARFLGLSPSQTTALINSATASSIANQNQVNMQLDNALDNLDLNKGQALSQLAMTEATDSRDTKLFNDRNLYNRNLNAVNEFGTNEINYNNSLKDLTLTDYNSKMALLNALNAENQQAQGRLGLNMLQLGEAAQGIDDWILERSTNKRGGYINPFRRKKFLS